MKIFLFKLAQNKAHDVGRSIYVHLFGAIFGLAASKALHFSNIETRKKTSGYHSDLFAFIGTCFFWVFYPSINAVFAQDEGKVKAVVNTYLAMMSSTVLTVGMSSILGNGRFSAVKY